MVNIKKYTLTLGDVTNNGKKCTNPIVELLGSGDFSIACIDQGKNVYELEGVFAEDTCVDILVRCAECDNCPPIEIRKCICSGDAGCADCEFCDESGFCESRCPEDWYCLNETCVECDNNTPCADGKVCKSGRCVCPQNAPFELNGKCLECIEDAPCRDCENGVYINRDCSGKCDPLTDDCVDCLTTTDCDGDNECCDDKKCDCCEGYVRDAFDNCVPKPQCDENTPCPSCTTCVDGNCQAIVCPDGMICLGEFGCVEACDCNNPTACTDDKSTCVSRTQGCGCVSCQGDCTTGCSEGCYCNGTECVGDVCFGGKCPCSDGTDCPDGYGCDGTGNCVPCAAQGCSNSECSNVLGCSCSGDTCVDSDLRCNNTECTTSSDCDFGCACDGGICTSCENYSCAQCGSIEGCGCSNGNCAGVETECSDTFTLTKDDNTCTLTASLDKDASCACPPITVDVKTRKTVVNNTTTLSFLGEVRKGVYTGDLNLPLVDDLSSPAIVENDSPISGAITVRSVSQYREYDVNPVTGIRGSATIVVEAAKAVSASFAGGGVATLNIGDISYPVMATPIVTETDDQGRTTKEIEYFLTEITVSITDEFNFPNECTYRENKEIGRYRITSNGAFDRFGLAFGNHVATNITSSDSRLPIFRWYKSDTPTISGSPFRKLYIPLQDGNYSDTINSSDELEACHYYKVTTDCSCTSNPSLYAVFCTPNKVDYTVDQCGKRLTIKNDIIIPCIVNYDVEFYLRAGDIYVTWLGTRWVDVAGQRYLSTTPITEVEFGQVCDTQNTCTKIDVIETVFNDLLLNIEPECNSNSLTAEVFIPPTDSSGNCNVVKVVINGEDYFPNTTYTLPIGAYDMSVVWGCGCDRTTQTFSVECCNIALPTISRDCQGVTACGVVDGATYNINGVPVASQDVCSQIANTLNTEAIIISVNIGNCGETTTTLPPIGGDCCSDFSVISNVSGKTATIEVFGDDDATLIITPQNSGVTTPVVTSLGGGVFTATPIDDNNTYSLTVTSSGGCSPLLAVVMGNKGTNDCTKEVNLEIVSGNNGICVLEANTDLNFCPCEQGRWDVLLSNVQNVDNDRFSVNYSLSLSGFEADPTASSGNISDAINSFNTNIQVENSGTLIVDKVFSNAGVIQSNMTANYSVATFPGTTNVAVNLAGVANISQITSITVDPTGLNPATKTAPVNSTFGFNSVPNPPATLQFNVIVNYSGSSSQSFTHVVDLNEGNQSFSETLSYTDKTEEWSNIRVKLDTLTLEDGCRYADVDTTFKVKSDGSFFSGVNNVSLALVPVIAEERKKKFGWNKDGVEVFEEYQLETSVIPEALLEQGSNYMVTATCGECVSTDSVLLCCDISVNAESSACGDDAIITIEGIPGSYTVSLGGQNTVATIVQQGTPVVVTLPVSNGSFTGFVEPVGINTCRENFSLTVFPQPTVDISFSAGEFTLNSFNTSNPNVVTYCLFAGGVNVATFTSNNPPTGQTFSNSKDELVTLVGDCGGEDCETYFTPDPTACGNITANVVVVPNGSTADVTVPTATSDPSCNVVTMELSGTQTAIWNEGATFNVPEGSYTYILNLDCSCPPITGSFTVQGPNQLPLTITGNTGFEDGGTPANPCGNAMTLERILDNGVYTVQGLSTGGGCPCDDGTLEFNILSAQDSGANNGINVNYEVNVTGVDPAIVDQFELQDVTRGVNYPISSGSNFILLPQNGTTTTVTEDFRIAYEAFSDNGTDSLTRLDGVAIFAGGSGIFDPTLIQSGTLEIRLNGMYITFTSGSGITFPVAGAYNPAVGSLPNRFRFPVSGFLSPTIPWTDWVTNAQFIFNLNLVSGEQKSFTVIPAPRTPGVTPEVIVEDYPNFTYTVGSESPVELRINTIEYITENNCTYTGTTPSIEVDSTGILTANPVSTPLLASGNTADTTFTWLEDGVGVSGEAVPGGSRIAPTNAKVGSVYNLTTECGACTESLSLRLCPAVMGSAQVSACLDEVVFNFTGQNGRVYKVLFMGSDVTTNVSGGTFSATFPTSLAENSSYGVAVELDGQPGCTHTFTFTTGTKAASCP